MKIKRTWPAEEQKKVSFQATLTSLGKPTFVCAMVTSSTHFITSSALSLSRSLAWSYFFPERGRIRKNKNNDETNSKRVSDEFEEFQLLFWSLFQVHMLRPWAEPWGGVYVCMYQSALLKTSGSSTRPTLWPSLEVLMTTRSPDVWNDAEVRCRGKQSEVTRQNNKVWLWHIFKVLSAGRDGSSFAASPLPRADSSNLALELL